MPTRKRSRQPRPSPLLPLVVSLEILLGTGLAAASLLLFSELSEHIIAKQAYAFDITFSRQLYSLRTPAFTDLMLFLSFLGNQFLGILLVLISLYLIKRNRWRETLVFVFTFLTGIFLNFVLKDMVARARPDIAPLFHESFYSFPSGHSMNSMVLYGLVVYLYYHLTKNTTGAALLGIFMLLLVGLIGLSRIYLGVHYPTDVLAGFLMGAWWLLTVLVIDKTLFAFDLFRHKR